MHKSLVFACAALLCLAGCAIRPSPRPEPAGEPAIAGIAPDDSLYATLWQQGALEHDMIYAEVYRNAQSKLLRALRDPHWDALPKNERAAVRHGSLRGLKPAVVLDIDETVLDNSPFQARQIESGKAEFDRAAFAAWIREADARPLPGALEFTRYAVAHGIRVIFISNRSQDFLGATIENLKREGFPVADKDAVLNSGAPTPGCEAEGSNKGCRRERVAREYRVLMEIGDNLADFLDIGENTPQGRERAIEPYRQWIGERWFALPNPVYGSWLGAVDGTAETPAARRAAEHAALRTQ
jgi:5'-nucleotidase (lipoprotein e(P4) family)